MNFITIAINEKEKELLDKALDYVINDHYLKLIGDKNSEVFVSLLIAMLMKTKISSINHEGTKLVDLDVYYNELNILLFALYYYIPTLKKEKDIKVSSDLLIMINCEKHTIKEQSNLFMRLPTSDQIKTLSKAIV